jgi:hypothetical protein
MILNENVEIKVHTKNKLLYKENKIGDIIQVNVFELTKGSNVKIDVRCDNCPTTNKISYYDYNRATKDNTRKYYCNKCSYIHTQNTISDKYGDGITNVMHIKEVKERHKDSVNSVDFIEADRKRKDTNNDRYGVDYVQQNKDINDKTSKTVEDKYGVKYIFHTVENIEKSITSSHTEESNKKRKNSNKNRIILNIKNCYDIDVIDYDGDIYTIYCDKGHEYTTTDITIYNRGTRFKSTQCTICNPISSFADNENEIVDFLNNINIECERNNRLLIKPKELDIYIPSHNLAIEFNGVYWNSDKYRDRNYHRNKFNECVSNGIKLISIWEDDWVNNKDIIKDIIKKRLNILPNNILYARKCIIKNVSIDEQKIFLFNNHIQGYVPATYSYGLYLDDMLVSMMTFGKRMIGHCSEDMVEILRYANKIDFGVIGGVEKLFNHFLKNTSYTTIKSFSDPSYFEGSVYNKLGFELKSFNNPSYFYVKNFKRYHRTKFTKSNLVDSGYDENLSEYEIMMSIGYHRIYDIGQYVYIFNR